jgi:hypothetical protein
MIPMYNRRNYQLSSYRPTREEINTMKDIWLIVGLVLTLALTVYISFKMAVRQQVALAQEKRPVPPRAAIVAFGFISILSFIIAIIAVILVLLAPFMNLTFAGTIENTTNVLFIIVFAAFAAGMGSYWIFAKLGFLSWKVFNRD